MNIKIQEDCSNIDWDLVSDTLKRVGMGYHEGEVHRKAFEKSYRVVFVFDDSKMVGFGRALSDGEYQGAIYDVAVLPEYQGKGIGRLIVSNITESLPQCNFILFASPGKEGFYEKLGFRRMLTAMALFRNEEVMEKSGFTG